MNLDTARALADAVMMEGYALYPFRASAPKNQFRWTFGVLAPKPWSQAGGCESWWLQTQILVAGRPTRIDGQLRFFQIDRRRVEDTQEREVRELDSDGVLAVGWDEGAVQNIAFTIPGTTHIAIPGTCSIEPHPAGRIIRERKALTGEVIVTLDHIATDPPLSRITIRVENTTPFPDVAAPRHVAVAAAFASTHLIVGVTDGELVSAIDPPEWAMAAAAACTNIGTYPVLVGPTGSHDLMLSAPFVMYDHAQLAPESTGDFCDATEIDELLTLRTQTLTAEEKRYARATDPRAAEIIDRSDGLPNEWLARLHGAARDLNANEMVPRAPQFTPGDKVRLIPSTRRTDAQDLLYAGHVATVAEIRDDVDGTRFLAVTIDDDPAAELHDWYGRYHYYRTDEVEPI